MKQLAVRTFDTAIAAHRNPNGSFGDIADSPDITSMTFGVELGTSILELRSALSPQRLRRWTDALAGAADFLIANKNLTWYTNGNINLGNAELFYLAWRATGDARFRAAYNQAWNFALYPPQQQWAGFGLRMLPASAVNASGARVGGAAGYLAESGGGIPGFDPQYTELQLDVATRLWLLSRDPRALRLVNLLLNAVLTRTNTSDWELNGTGGTRHPAPDGGPVTTPALAVLVLTGHRRNLAGLAVSEFQEINSIYRGSWPYGNPGYARGYGNEVSVILMAAQMAAPRVVVRDYAAMRNG
jgi:hypothetical protein